MLGGRYRLGRAIGRGGMGEVFLAEDTVLGREVAVKHILPGDEDPTVATQRLLREARSAARIHHPNVVTVHDLVLQGNEAYIVMEYVPAENLAQVLRRGPLDPRRVARIGAQVAGALAAAHALGIIHRDVKPSNILLAPGDVAKLTDFGVARVAGDTGLTQTGHMIGSIAYLPPEIARGADPAPAADLYSLGATLFAAVEGHPPFAGRDDSSTSVAMLVRLVTETAPAAAHADVLAPLIAELLDPDPKRRPTARAAADALSAARTDVAPLAQSPVTIDPGSVDEEALIETRVRPATPPQDSRPAGTSHGSMTGAPAAARHEPAPAAPAAPEPDGSPAVDDRTIRRPPGVLLPADSRPPAPRPADPKPAASKVEPAKPPAPERPAHDGAATQPATVAWSPRPGPRPPQLTPIQQQKRRRRQALTVVITLVALGVVGTPIALLLSQPTTVADGPDISEPTATAEQSHSLPTPAEPESAPPFSYKTYQVDLIQEKCSGEGLESLETEASDGSISVTVYLERALKGDDSVSVDFYLPNGDAYSVTAQKDFVNDLWDSQKEDWVSGAEGSVDGKVIYVLVPLSKLKPKAPVSVDADLSTSSIDSSCGVLVVE